ncbi:hypothetical protein G6F57_015607 [Rhizopus arrhizus]|nr:hypothetical protein G6F57_015607 [Rhizopus arrhizus]
MASKSAPVKDSGSPAPWKYSINGMAASSGSPAQTAETSTKPSRARSSQRLRRVKAASAPPMPTEIRKPFRKAWRAASPPT